MVIKILKLMAPMFLVAIAVLIPLVGYMNEFVAMFFACLIMYSIYLVSSICHVLFIRKKAGYQYWVIYPFTFDGKCHFQPTKLFAFDEMVRDMMPVNLWQDYNTSGVSEQLIKKMNDIRVSRELNRFFAVVLVFQALKLCGVDMPIWSYILFYGSIYIFSYLGNNTIWIGSGAVLRYGKIDEFFLLKSYLKDIATKRYRVYLRENYSKINKTILLNIMFNYCQALKREGVTKEDEDLIADILQFLGEKIYDGVGNFVLLNYLVYTIGFLGVEKKSRLVEISREFLMMLRAEFLGAYTSFSPPMQQLDRMDYFLTFLETGDKSILEMKHYVLKLPTLF